MLVRLTAHDVAKGNRGRLIVLHVLAPFYTGPEFPSEDAIAWTPSKDLLAELQTRLQALVARTPGAARAPPSAEPSWAIRSSASSPPHATSIRSSWRQSGARASHTS